MAIKIPTLRQFADARRREMAAECDVTLAEVEQTYPLDFFYADWWGEFVAAVELGRMPSTSTWRSLTEHEQRHLLRTSRALRDPHFAYALTSMTQETS